MAPFSLRGDIRFLAGGGDMGARIRAHDWSATPLGAPRRWPQALRIALDICLNSSFPTALYWGPDLRLLYNDAWSPIPAQKHPWALGQPAREVWADIWDIIEPQFARVIESGVGFSTFDQMLPMEREGRIEETYWNYSFTPIRDEHGAVAGIFNQGHETTAKVLADRQRQTEIERWRELFQQTPGAIALLRGPEHVFEIANDAYLQLIGRRDIIGKRVAEVLPESVGQGFLELLDRVYRTGETYVGASASIALQRSPGSEPESRILDFVYQPTQTHGGAVAGIFVQATDVTERARAEAAMRASEEHLRRLNQELEARVARRTAELSSALARLQTTFGRLRTAFETSFIYQGYMDPDGTLLDANDTSLAGIRAAREDVVGKPFWQTPWFTGTPGMPEFVREGVEAAARGEPVRRIITLRLPIGERAFDFYMRPVRNDADKVIGIVPEGVDVTMRLQTEEHLRQSQKMEALGQLTGGIAHDFNNLLTGIIGSLDLMVRRIAQGRYDSVQQYANAAMTSANRAAALTQHLLAFSRRQPLEPKTVDANALLAGMEDMLRRTLSELVELDVRTSGGLWLTRCDPNQLESAILNLVINARDAMPEGGRITIATSNAELDEQSGAAPGRYVCIRVADDGSGMTDEVVEKAFEPFFTTKPLGHGTGLGLSMAYGFIKQSNGHVALESKVGVGTTIRLYLPRHRGEIEAADEASGATASYRALTGETVLLVEDEEVVRQFTGDVLRDLGYRVLEAVDGARGLDVLLAGERIDLVVCDVGLPELNGRQMAARARERRPDLKFLFITGYVGDAAFDVDALDERTQLIVKPFPVEALAQRVREMIAR